jgi:hypothetical protein
MLLNKATMYEAGQIVTFKIVNGDEIIARIVVENDDDFMVDQPVTLVPSERGMMMVPSMFTLDKNNSIPIRKSNIIMHTLTREDAASGYRETTTGIQAVRKPGIIV